MDALEFGLLPDLEKFHLPLQRIISPSIQFSILTDPSSYLDATVASLEKTEFFKEQSDLPIRLVAGHPEPHLDKYKNDRRFIVDEMSEAETLDICWSESNGGVRCHKGHRRAMHPMRFRPGTTHLCIFECDVEFSVGWRQYLNGILRDLILAYQDRFVLSLYTPGNASGEAEKRGKKWFNRDIGFYGAQGLLFPTAMCAAFIQETDSRPVDQALTPEQSMDRTYGIPYDLLLQRIFIERFKVPIVSVAPCLIQHIGYQSRIGSPWHVSESWRPKI